MVFYPGVYSRKVTRRYRYKQTPKQKRKQGRYGNVNVGKIASDLVKVKKMLNVEHKMIATNYGTIGTDDNPSIQFRPSDEILLTRANPTFVRIGYPIKGTNSYNRIGNSIKTISISAKINTSFLFPSFGASGPISSARLLNPYVDVYIMMRKASATQAGTALPTIDEIFYPDSNGGYNAQCFRRKETIDQYTVLAKKRLTANLNSSLTSGETNVGLVQDKFCTLATNKPLYFKWTPGSDNVGVEGSYSECQDGLLFALFMTNCVDRDNTNGLTSAVTYAQFQMTFVDN